MHMYWRGAATNSPDMSSDSFLYGPVGHANESSGSDVGLTDLHEVMHGGQFFMCVAQHPHLCQATTLILCICYSFELHPNGLHALSPKLAGAVS